MSSTPKLTVTISRSTDQKINDVCLATGRRRAEVVRTAFQHYFSQDRTEQMWSAQFNHLRRLQLAMDELKRRMNTVACLVMTSSHALFMLSPLLSKENYDRQKEQAYCDYNAMLDGFEEMADRGDGIYPEAVRNYIVATTSDPDAYEDATKMLNEIEEEFREADRKVAENFNDESLEDQERRKRDNK